MTTTYTEITAQLKKHARTKLFGSISVLNDPPHVFIWAGAHLCSRIRAVRKWGRSTFERKLLVTHANGNEYTISNADRGYYYVDGPDMGRGIQVKGWADGLKLLDTM